uniref:Uncharacterized protein n=1 Tax=Zosterops lateralis melanops TaxID=1220523 RepID=A0A8D2PLJ7_ZOSLA
MMQPAFPPCLQTFLLSCSLVVFPLYRSSKETLQNKAFLLATIHTFPLMMRFNYSSS